MKNLFFSIATVAIMGTAFTSCQNDTLNSFENGEVMNTRSTASYTVDDVAGDYVGTLDTINMNGSLKNPIPGKTIHITRKTATTLDLHLPAFQAGNMPGTIEIKAENITLAADGTFYVSPANRAVILRILLSTRYYDGKPLKGRFTRTANGGYGLEFSVNTNGTYLSIPFTTYVHFTGSK